MLNSLRSARTHHPSLFPYSLPNHFTRIPTGIKFARAASGSNLPHSSQDMEPKQDPKSKSKTGDTMSSFGDGYSTRSDEEGFGGIYGGNQTFPKANNNEEKMAHDNLPEFDHNQGSEVKEKERARHQNKVAS